jgi:hypothetical protein
MAEHTKMLRATAVPASTTVWVSPGATVYSCLCEHCLERARLDGRSLFEALHGASVRGSIAVGSDVAFARCTAGHEIFVRRVERPQALARHDQGQLRLA